MTQEEWALVSTLHKLRVAVKHAEEFKQLLDEMEFDLDHGHSYDCDFYLDKLCTELTARLAKLERRLERQHFNQYAGNGVRLVVA